jgi:hypothetical protein
MGDTQLRSWLRHYAINSRVAGSSPDDVIVFSIYLMVYQEMFLGSRAWPASKSDNLTTICVPVV